MHSNSDRPKSGFEKGIDPAPQGQPRLDSRDLGTKSSNTVPSTSINSSNTKVLRTGIDSLYVSYRGQMYNDSSIKLGELKKLAQSDSTLDSSLAQYRAGDQILEVRGNGRHPYAYVLVDGWFRLELAKLNARKLPMAYSKISSHLLTAMGHDFAMDALNSVICTIGRLESSPNVSRIDLCVDFLTDCPLDQLCEHEFVTKARSFDRHTVAREFSGFSFSAGASTSARLYNKTLEMKTKKHPRPDLELQWRKNGWDGEQNVWRLEFQFRRSTLAAFNLVPWDIAKNSCAELWEYATKNWLRHTYPSFTDNTQSRWPTSSYWEALQNADWGNKANSTLSRIYPDKSRVPSDDFLYINGLSTLTSFAAREGYVHIDDAVQAYVEAVKDFHDGRVDRTGIDFENYFRQKVDAKHRTYNTAFNEPVEGGTHPVDLALAWNNRKRSDADY